MSQLKLLLGIKVLGTILENHKLKRKQLSEYLQKTRNIIFHFFILICKVLFFYLFGHV